jgi:hypothetical protein
MRYTVPQFIEKEPKVFGPLTFKQFIYLAIPGGIVILLFFTLGKQNFLLFLLISTVLLGIGGVLGFLRIGGKSLPVFIIYFFKHSLTPKSYYWHRKEKMITKIFTKEGEVKEEESFLKIRKKGQMEELRAKKGLF